MTQAWPIMICYPQGHDNWPDGLVPEPEQVGASPEMLWEYGNGKLSLSPRVSELELCKTRNVSDSVLPFFLCLGECMAAGE